jgi:aminopeptidase
MKHVYDLVNSNSHTWLVVPSANDRWADKLFPDIPQNKRKDRLWEKIFEMCHINQKDPVMAWRNHINDLTKRSNYLNEKQYSALKLTAPGTDLTIGLPKGHIWRGGSSTSKNGILFTANMPTEEIFTMPHREKVEGYVSTTKTVCYGGITIERCCLTFSKGRIVEATAEKGESFLHNTIETDEGAHRLGEIALVPHSSPISQTDLVYYDMLIDENASNHIALGKAYRDSLSNGKTLTEEEFEIVGGNYSLIHLDFMIGSGEMNVGGILEDDSTEPLMRNGEWAFEV